MSNVTKYPFCVHTLLSNLTMSIQRDATIVATNTSKDEITKDNGNVIVKLGRSGSGM